MNYADKATIGYARAATEPMCAPVCDTDVMRAFPDLSSRVSIAHEAASFATQNLSELMGRLGVSNNYGTACGNDKVEPTCGGELDALTRQIDRLTDMVRDIRGLAETLNSRL